jgi:hypothetical protein
MKPKGDGLEAAEGPCALCTSEVASEVGVYLGKRDLMVGGLLRLARKHIPASKQWTKDANHDDTQALNHRELKKSCTYPGGLYARQKWSRKCACLCGWCMCVFMWNNNYLDY